MCIRDRSYTRTVALDENGVSEQYDEVEGVRRRLRGPVEGRRRRRPPRQHGRTAGPGDGARRPEAPVGAPTHPNRPAPDSRPPLSREWRGTMLRRTAHRIILDLADLAIAISATLEEIADTLR